MQSNQIPRRTRRQESLQNMKFHQEEKRRQKYESDIDRWKKISKQDTLTKLII